MKANKEIIYNEEDMPMPISKINKFERDNDLVINVYSYEKDEILRMRISKRRDKEPINLLLLENERTYHY